MNIAKILKKCPKDMELYSPIFGKVKFVEVTEDGWIRVSTPTLQKKSFYPDGTYSKNGEIMLFPSKECRNWDDFQIPFKKGDIVAGYNETYHCVNIGIFDHYEENDKYCILSGVTDDKGIFHLVDYNYDKGIGWAIKRFKYATDLEIETLKKAMQEAGYHLIDNKIYIIPKFEVGDRLIWKIDPTIPQDYYIMSIMNDRYILSNGSYLFLQDQNGYELDKFNPQSLNPYDKVLIKEGEDGCWIPTLISYVTTSEVFVIEKNDPVEYVIPYEPNKHLVGKFDDPDKYYITW